MRFHIDTIPVIDAFRAGGECPLCDLMAANEAQYLDNFLGASVMEPDVRIEVNEKGFCAHHLARMLPMKNRLGLALMTHTHLQETVRRLPAAPQKQGIFAKKAAASAHVDTCVLCERLSVTMERYFHTVVHLWKTDADFRKLFDASKGVCLPHYRALMDIGTDAFAKKLEEIQRENLARIEGELHWFTQKFDYRNADKPWGTSEDALERAIVKLRGVE